MPGTVAGSTVMGVSNLWAPAGLAVPGFTGEAAEAPVVGSLSSLVIFWAPTVCSGHGLGNRESKMTSPLRAGGLGTATDK